MRPRHTTRTDADLAGGTIQRAVRLPEVQVKAVLDAIAAGLPDIHYLTDAVVDALWLWLYENEHHADAKPASVPKPAPEPAPLIDAESFNQEDDDGPPEATEADRPYQGTQERPKWADVDVAVLGADD